MFLKQIAFVLLMIFVAPFAMAAKPGASLALQMEWVSPVVKGGVSEFKVTILSSISTSRLQLKIDLPENVAFVEGEPLVTVAAEQGKPVQRLYRVLVAENAKGSISARVSMGATGKAYFSAGNELFISPDEASSLKARKNADTQYTKTIRNGVKVREYQLTK